jgi:Na+-translocating ferredoxin:NAD+ oxidoreductase subunit C
MDQDGVIVFKGWNLKGGLDLEGHKDLSRQYSINNTAIPDELIYPLVDRSGNVLTALAKTGERVLKGQVIAGSKGVQGTLLHAASSGLVKENEWRMIAHPSGLKSECLIVATDGLDECCPIDEPVDYRQLSRPIFVKKFIKPALWVSVGQAFQQRLRLPLITFIPSIP